MNARSILNNLVSFVSHKMHKTRKQAVVACVRSLIESGSATVTSMGRGIRSNAYEKHRIKRADRLLSNGHLQREVPFIYAMICRLFCTCKHPVIAVDWSDLDKCKKHFLLRAAIVVKGRPITLYQEVRDRKASAKATTHRDFLEILHTLLPDTCQPIIVTDAGYKSPWFREVQALRWHIVGRVRKPHLYSLDGGNEWQSIAELYLKATTRPKRFDNALIVKSRPFACTLVLVKEKAKGRRAFNANGSRQRDTNSLKYADGARDPWLLATSLPYHRHLSKQVIDIYRQRMQIEEGFRDMKSTRFGLGYENNRSTTKTRITVLVLLTTLASLVAVLLGMLLVVSNKHRRFQANTETKSVLSFHFLGLRAFNTSMRFTLHQWKKTIRWLDELTAEACMSKITC